MLWFLMNLVLYPLITVVSNIYVVYQLIWYSYVPGMLQESVLRRCNEAFVESMAQFCIQLMILLDSWRIDNNVQTFQVLSIFTSFLSISSGSAAWFCLNSGNDKPDMLVNVNVTFLYALILAPRLFGAALLLAYEREIGFMMITAILLLSFLTQVCINMVNELKKRGTPFSSCLSRLPRV